MQVQSTYFYPITCTLMRFIVMVSVLEIELLHLSTDWIYRTRHGSSLLFVDRCSLQPPRMANKTDYHNPSMLYSITARTYIIFNCQTIQIKCRTQHSGKQRPSTQHSVPLRSTILNQTPIFPLIHRYLKSSVCKSFSIFVSPQHLSGLASPMTRLVNTANRHRSCT